jgi:sRNA-binding protein
MNDMHHILPAEAKRNTRYRVRDMIAALADLFPATFILYERRRKPLKIGIHADLLARLDGALTTRETSIALGHYCRAFGYLAACKPGATRIDLDGNPAGIVDEREAEHAACRLAELRAKKSASAKKTPAPVKKMPMPQPAVVVGTIVGNRARTTTMVVVKRRRSQR